MFFRRLEIADCAIWNMYINFVEYIYSFGRKVFIIVQQYERTALEKCGLFFHFLSSTFQMLTTAVYLSYSDWKDHRGHWNPSYFLTWKSCLAHGTDINEGCIHGCSTAKESRSWILSSQQTLNLSHSNVKKPEFIWPFTRKGPNQQI